MQQQFSRVGKIFGGGSSIPYQFSGLNWWGWSRGVPSGTTFNLMFDDIYLATGPNAAARVELGNAPVYSDATKLAISTPDSWSDTQISVTIREGPFTQDDDVYLFVIDSDNQPSLGYGPINMENNIATSIPVISFIEGEIKNSNNISIFGSGFGTKNPAAPILWDDFENGVNEELLSTSGYWTPQSQSTLGSIYSNISTYSGKLAGMNRVAGSSAVGPDMGGFNSNYFDFDGTDIIYYSYNYKF